MAPSAKWLSFHRHSAALTHFSNKCSKRQTARVCEYVVPPRYKMRRQSILKITKSVLSPIYQHILQPSPLSNQPSHSHPLHIFTAPNTQSINLHTSPFTQTPKYALLPPRRRRSLPRPLGTRRRARCRNARRLRYHRQHNIRQLSRGRRGFCWRSSGWSYRRYELEGQGTEEDQRGPSRGPDQGFRSAQEVGTG